jgi:hypothetical protein
LWRWLLLVELLSFSHWDTSPFILLTYRQNIQKITFRLLHSVIQGQFIIRTSGAAVRQYSRLDNHKAMSGSIFSFASMYWSW